jgi:predicted metal-dependent peptidase
MNNNIDNTTTQPILSFKEIEEQIQLFLSLLYLKHPFYNSLLSSVNISIENTELSNKHGIYSIDNETIIIDHIFASTEIQKNIKVFFYFIIHELLHIMLKHKYRGIGKNQNKWTKATDMAVDSVFSKDKTLLKYISHPETEKGINTIYDFEEKVSSSAEDFYTELKEQQENESNDKNCDCENGSKSNKQNKNNTLNNHSTWNTTKIDNDNKINNEENKINEKIIKAYEFSKLQNNDTSNDFGGGLGSFLEIIEELLKPSTNILNYITKIVQEFKKHSSTYKRPDRRYLYKNLIVPSSQKNIKHFKLLFYIDTSGSVEIDSLQKVMSDIFYIVSTLDSFEIDIMQSDADDPKENMLKLNNQNITTKKEELFKIQGRGGTEFSPLFEYLKEDIKTNIYDIIILASDYWISQSDKNEVLSLENNKNLSNNELANNIKNICHIVTKNYNKKITRELKHCFYI